jgi:hypothetical protein
MTPTDQLPLAPWIVLPCSFDVVHGLMTSCLKKGPISDTPGRAIFAVTMDRLGKIGTLELQKVSEGECCLTIFVDYSDDRLAEKREAALLDLVRFMLTILRRDGGLPDGDWQDTAAFHLLTDRGRTHLASRDELDAVSIDELREVLGTAEQRETARPILTAPHLLAGWLWEETFAKWPEHSPVCEFKTYPADKQNATYRVLMWMELKTLQSNGGPVKATTPLICFEMLQTSESPNLTSVVGKYVPLPEVQDYFAGLWGRMLQRFGANKEQTALATEGFHQTRSDSVASMKTEQTVTLNGKTLKDVRRTLEECAYREQDPVMLVLFGDPGCVSGALKQMHTTGGGRRLPDELHRGTLKATPGADGVRIVFQLGDFPDRYLFWQKVNELLLKLGVPLPAQSTDDSVEGKRGGRPRSADDDWAYQEIKAGRDQAEVYAEWLERISVNRRSQLADPLDSFKKAMTYRRKQEKRE